MINFIDFLKDSCLRIIIDVADPHVVAKGGTGLADCLDLQYILLRGEWVIEVNTAQTPDSSPSDIQGQLLGAIL